MKEFKMKKKTNRENIFLTGKKLEEIRIEFERLRL